ncbi:alginate lyase family protein [Mesorhizobium sp. YIM 152430]|uniref:heparinase II/III family protein n=1 Tax=Mesorhizobium sp. YIM 152430 TaxID=3031761 RepID=UPI0023DA5455|nr:alginate lyase family protein [Mesorhizobium sp. YIM 152430]MDF1599549.1 alginate lyase family protein [Mesorhizobium sp. YIM 152430]
MSLGWYVNRLRNMGPAEVAHRVVEKSRKLSSKGRHEGWARFGQQGDVVPRVPGLEDAVLHASPPVREALDRTCAALLDGRFSALGVDWPKRSADTLFPVDIWRLDPVSGLSWPGADAYCFDIGYRHETRFGDVKYVWEFNRLQFLQPLAAKLALDDDTDARRVIESVIESWHRAHPPFRGLVWNSGIELALRAISLLVVSSICGSHLSPDTIRRIREILAAHAFWLTRFPSRFSSANNHLIAEAAGEYLIGIALPDLAGAGVMAAKARKVLEKEIEKQILPDGVPAEQSPTYGAFSIEFALLAALAARHQGDPFGPNFESRLDHFAGWVAAISSNCAAPAICDDDEGRVIAMCEPEPRYPAAIANAAMAFLGRPSPVAAPAPHLRDAIFGEAAQAEPRAHSGIIAFREGGYSVLDAEICGRHARLIMDHGPLGYLSIAAHGHADALSILLCVDGEPILVDPGTYLYHSGGAWRDWFRSTRAHNTLTIAGTDQSIMSGAFNWSHKANARLVEASDTAILAEHDGYSARYGATHRRQVCLAEEGLRIEDEVSGKPQPVEISFQFAPGLDVRIVSAVASVSKDEIPIATFTLPGDRLEVASGGDGFDGGWISPSFGVKIPAPRLSWRGQSGVSPLVTEIRLIQRPGSRP